jgi:hypothetical protein
MRTLFVIALVLALGACKSRSKSGHGEPAAAEQKQSVRSQPDDNESGGGGRAMALDEGKMGKKDTAVHSDFKMQRGSIEKADEPAPPASVAVASPAPEKTAKNSKESAAATRAWFPETFLFEPLVVTDDQGAATFQVRVPDRLTTWHVLALAHSRGGAQGGTETSFLGTLATYIDPVVPKTLVVGDEIRLPIQLVNTTTAPVATSLAVEASNATIAGAGGARVIPAQGSVVDYATLRASQPGRATIKATLGTADAVVRTIDVVPSGRPLTTRRSGTLAMPRTMKIEGPANSDPSTDRVRLLVFPGALALLRSELGVSTSREGVADDAYALLLAGKATAMLAALGDKSDPEAVRTLSIITAQRAIRDARTLDVSTAALLAEAALAHPQNPVLARLGERAAAYLAQNQRPDGSFAGATGWTLQRLLVVTAEATRAVAAATAGVPERQRAKAVQVRAAGAFERNLDHVEDGYTAAAILASGAVDGAVADKLRAKVIAAIKASDDGAKYLDVGPGVVRADGAIPSREEATGLAVLALDGDPKAPLADLGATLLGTYSPDRGWGDGRANLVCMRAVIQMFKAPVPDNVKVTLKMDGDQIATGVLDRDKLKDVLVLEAPAPGLAGKHEWQVIAEPAVPGLGYSLALRSWVPWEKETTHGGLELALPPTVNATVGRPTELSITAIAPSGIELHIEQSLPAGVQADTPSLTALVTAGTIAKFETADGKVDLHVAPLQPGQMFTAKYKVIPTLAGHLRAAASLIEAGSTEFHVPPTEWTIQ